MTAASSRLSHQEVFITLDRQKFVITKALCFNCLKGGHRSNIAGGKKSCHKCNKRHHTLIHFAPSY